MHVDVHVSLLAGMCVRTLVCMCVCPCVWMCVRMCVGTCVRMCVCMFVCTCVCTCACTCVCACVCTCVRMYYHMAAAVASDTVSQRTLPPPVVRCIYSSGLGTLANVATGWKQLKPLLLDGERVKIKGVVVHSQRFRSMSATQNTSKST